MSKEHRVDPPVQVGLLVDPGGFPLEVHLFEGNKAETTTLIPVLTAFQARHGVTDMVVVADAGMLSAANLGALEDAGFSFIVASRITKAPTTWPTTSSGTAPTSPTGRSWSPPG
jgi:transposase